MAELKALTRDQDSLIQMQTRLVNQLTACLKAYYPVALQLFSKLQQPSTLTFLQTYPTPGAARAASVEQITRCSRGGHTTPKVAPTIYEPCISPLASRRDHDPTKSRLLLTLVAAAAPGGEIADYDKAIERFF